MDSGNGSRNIYADGPLPLVSTPSFQTSKTDPFTEVVFHMALVHNVMIHGYNSIYLQAPRIVPVDVPDFVNYCLTWYEEAKGHHHNEEVMLFPLIEESTGVRGIMDGDRAEHEAFYGGLEKVKAYLDVCLADLGTYSGKTLVTCLDGFANAFHEHLIHEPVKLMELSAYPSLDIQSIADKTAQYSMQGTFMVYGLPQLWYNLDVDFEGGRWKSFPEVLAPVKWILINVVGWWRWNWWRFGSSDAKGRQKPLLALSDDYGQ